MAKLAVGYAGPSRADLLLVTTHAHGRNVVHVAGDIDIATAPALQTYLCDAVDANAGNPSRVVMVDLSAVTFMDVSGLRPLIRAETYAYDLGVRVHLTALTPHITRLLQITRLDRHFRLCPTSGRDRLPPAGRP